MRYASMPCSFEGIKVKIPNERSQNEPRTSHHPLFVHELSRALNHRIEFVSLYREVAVFIFNTLCSLDSELERFVERRVARQHLVQEVPTENWREHASYFIFLHEAGAAILEGFDAKHMSVGESW